MEYNRFDICTWRDLIDWCRMKVEHEKFFHRSGNYCRGYEDAMNAVMSKLSDLEHKEKENKAWKENKMIQELKDILHEFADMHDMGFACMFNEMTLVYSFQFHNKERSWVYYRELTAREIREWDQGVEALAQDILSTLEKKIERMKGECDG